MQPLLILLWTLLLMDPTVQGSLNLSPDQSQFFTGVRLNLRCDDTNWKVWRKTQGTVMRCGDGDHDQNWGMYSGPWCTVKYLEMRDSGQYWCQSEEGETSESVTLSVADRGVILQMPVHPVYAGQTVRLICAHRTVSATKAIFYKNNQLLPEENGISMTFQQVAVSNEGLYHCEIKGEKSQPSQLRVKAPTIAPPISLSSTNVPLTTSTTEHSLPSWLFPVVASVVGVVLLIVLVLLVLLVKRCRCKKGKGKRRGKRRKGRAPPPPGHHTTGRCPHRTPKAPTQK